ncbi:MAG: hypothetical protein IJH25_18120, partial [Clostridia bacterium]|nr:hypothetical protein [Clostridia bacterium]
MKKAPDHRACTYHGAYCAGCAEGIELTEVTGAPGQIDEASVRRKYRQLTLDLIERGLTITTMESCTSGQV